MNEYTPRKQNPARAALLRGISIAIAAHMQIPSTLQLQLAAKLNSEYLRRARGKSGKTPTRRMYIKSVVMQKDHTNPIGHFT